MEWVCVLTYMTAFTSSVLCTWFMRRVAPRFGLIDHPAARKVHLIPKPLGGGVAIWAAFVLTIGAAYGMAGLVWSGIGGLDRWLPPEVRLHLPGMFSRGPQVALVIGIATVIMFMGLIDDRRGLSYVLRLVVEMGLVGILVWQGVRFTLFPPLSNVWLSSLLTIGWVVGLTNAFNFLDNMDALAGGVAWIGAALFCVLMGLTGDTFVAAFLLALMGSIGGFLCFNWPPASIFMGDAGSNFIGYMLGVITVLSTFTTPKLPAITIAAPLCVMAVPLYDSITVILIRLREGRSPFLPDKSHFSHRLVALGMTSKQAVLTIYLVTLGTGLGALLLYPLSEMAPTFIPRDMVPAMTAGVVLLQIMCLLGVVAVLEAAGRKSSNGNTASNPPPQS
jgi:UDP-GlcNAc:undecaprenyl-phosphate GlcNAc-1-phosphate transferase